MELECWYGSQIATVDGAEIYVKSADKETVKRYMVLLDHEGATEWSIGTFTKHQNRDE